MAKKCLIHIGGTKTGSSSIQKSLYNLFSKGPVKGVSYPVLTDPYVNHSHNLMTAFFQNYSRLQRQFRYLYAEDEVEEVSSGYMRDLSRNFSDNLIVSSEYLSFFSENEVSRLMNYFLKAGYTEFDILYYVRDPVSLYASAAQQQFKGAPSFVNPVFYSFSFRKVIEVWSKVFSGCNAKLRVRAFERDLLSQGCVVKDAFGQIADSFSVPQISDRIRVINTNEGISLEALKVLQKYRLTNHNMKDFCPTDDIRAVVRLLAKYQGTKPRLHGNICDYIYKALSDDLIWLKERFGVNYCHDFDENKAREAHSKFDNLPKRLSNLELIFQDSDKAQEEVMSYRLAFDLYRLRQKL